MSLFNELKRRNVFRVGATYLVAAWVIAQVASLVLSSFNAPDWIMQVSLLVLAVGFIGALIISWAYEINADGIQLEEEVLHDDSIANNATRKFDVIAIVAALIVTSLIGWQLFEELNGNSGNGTSSSQVTTIGDVSKSISDQIEGKIARLGQQSIAVLPFANRSNVDDDLYFTDGIHDDLLTQLSKIKDLKVISRTSVMKFRGSTKTIPEIAKELGVAAILEGGVQRAGKRLRINAQLIDVATDQHLWAETFDREMTIDGLFEIQSDITKRIVMAVKGKISVAESEMLDSKSTTSIAAWDAYSQARSIRRSSGHNADKFLAALILAEEAVELDPKFVLAQIYLTELHGLIYWSGYDRSEGRQEMARTALEAAIALSPQSAEVLAAQGSYFYHIQNDYASAYKFQQRALALKPGDAKFILSLALTERRLGLWDSAIDNLILADQLDPGDQNYISEAAGSLEVVGDAARLRTLLPAARARFPDSSDLGAYAVNLAIWTEGDIVDARRIYQDVKPNVGAAYALSTLNLTWFEREVATVLTALERPEILTFFSFIPGLLELHRGEAYHVQGNLSKASEEFSRAVELMSPNITKQANFISAIKIILLARAKAYLGETEQAVDLALQGMELFSVDIDKTEGPAVLQEACFVLALSGQRDEALLLLEKLLAIPSYHKRWYFYLDPRWDFFRDDERFNQLIKPQNFETSIYARKASKRPE
jgi:TolB-like protein/tetratricopeptide (TPR) repeat protein